MRRFPWVVVLPGLLARTDSIPTYAPRVRGPHRRGFRVIPPLSHWTRWTPRPGRRGSRLVV